MKNEKMKKWKNEENEENEEKWKQGPLTPIRNCGGYGIFGIRTFVPISWMCKKQGSASQFNRMRNHFLGRKVQVGRYTRTWFVGSDRRSSSREHASEWSSTGRPVQISNAKENSWRDWWSRQYWFSFLKREILIVRKLCCSFFEDNEAVIKMIIKGKSPTMRHVSRSHRVALDRLFIESIWTPRSKSSTSTPKTNSQTYWPRETPHVMNGIMFCVCSTSAISVPSIILNRCRKEHQKMQVKKESQQNQSRWWIWYHDAA